MAIQFKAKLWAGMEGKNWTFVTMPQNASEKLPKRARIAIKGTINGFAFKTSAFPDGEGSHQFMVNGTMRAGAKAAIGDTATFIIQPASDTVEFEIPSDLSAALKKATKASAQMGENHAESQSRMGSMDHLGEERRDAHSPDDKDHRTPHQRRQAPLRLKPERRDHFPAAASP